MKKENLFFENSLVKIYNDDFLKNKDIEKNSIDLIVTSPPYNVQIDYNLHNDKTSYKEYLDFTRKWLMEDFV